MHIARNTYRKGSDSGPLASGADGVASLGAMIKGVCTSEEELSNEGGQLLSVDFLIILTCFESRYACRIDEARVMIWVEEMHG